MDEPALDALAGYLSAQRREHTTVLGARRLSVGHSRAMYRVDTDGGSFVVRVEQGGVFGTSSGEEFGVMAGLARAGFPVAPVRWLEPSGSVLGRPFFVMDFIEGAELADERAMDEATAADFVRTMAELHALDWCSAGIDDALAVRPSSPEEATHLQIDRWAGLYRAAAAAPIPLLEEAAAWLHHRAPPLERLSVVHGDAGPGNVVQAGGRIVAVTDWEFAHLGDPAEDWSFCLSMRGSRTLPRETWLELFDRFAGFRMDEAGWSYWEAFNLFKGACANCTCLDLFERGGNRAPNMAIIGTVLHRSFLRRLVEVVHR
jgi:aminoglycoside phosphotransferase (APT) family kinase protein